MDRRAATRALIVLAAVPAASRAQRNGKVYRVGFLGVLSASDYPDNLNAFLQGLRELGYEDGKNLVIEFRWADGREERLPELAAQLVRLNPDVLVTHAIGVGAAQKATSSIPIVMGVSGDPVALGLVESLAKPGGNTTGLASQIHEIAPKRLELLKEAVPKLNDVAVLSSLAFPGSRRSLQLTEIAARRIGVRVRSFGVSAERDALDAVFASILRGRPDGLVVHPDPNTARHVTLIAAFAAKNGLPAIGGIRQFVVDGGLLSYGANNVEGWRVAARYVDKILKGARPADLPVEQAARFELVINLKTATDLGLALPPSLLLRASEVLR